MRGCSLCVGCVGGGDGGATLVCVLEAEMGVDCFAAPGGGAGRRRGAPFGAVFLPDTAELMRVDMIESDACCTARSRIVTEAWRMVRTLETLSTCNIAILSDDDDYALTKVEFVEHSHDFCTPPLHNSAESLRCLLSSKSDCICNSPSPTPSPWPPTSSPHRSEATLPSFIA